ncbi:hypothetical protein [Rhizobium herbae]|uniref:Uncharacterized protein n=1 Tax=Rhizobium herbae TaxID=508661 RepID=A0ABS4EIY0_9HYPH|nr:hypothetical protein [Rhizobium herbae]MBP1857781.1 hypothetical protein [Rhizobium herbae]
MKILLQAVTGFLLLFIITVWLGGLRLVVVPPASLLMHPTTALVADGHTYRMIDSPQAMCGRLANPATDCEQVAIRKLSKDALVKLPFNRWLYEFTDPERPVRDFLFGEATLRSSI